MKAAVFAKLDEGSLASAMELYERAASGASPEPLFAEDDTSLRFEKIKKLAKASAAAPSTTKEYMLAVLHMALYRDAVYAHETRGFMRALGTSNAVRSRYEAARPYVEAGE